MSINNYDEELYLVIEEIVAELDLEKGTPAYGVAIKVVHDGYDSLSQKQKYLYDTKVQPLVIAQIEEWRKNETVNSAPD